MPTQFWHHHAAAVNTSPAQPSEEEKDTYKFFEQQIDADCKVCSHQYTVYNTVAEMFIEPLSVIQLTKKERYTFSILPSPHFKFSNKGPPAKA
jgi:hypothetical protein